MILSEDSASIHHTIQMITGVIRERMAITATTAQLPLVSNTTRATNQLHRKRSDMALILVLLTLMRTFMLAPSTASLFIRLTKTRRPGTVLHALLKFRSSHQPRATTPFKSPSFLLSALSWRFRMTCPTVMSTPFSSLAATTMFPWRTDPGLTCSYLSPRAALQLIFTDSFIMSELPRSRDRLRACHQQKSYRRHRDYATTERYCRPNILPANGLAESCYGILQLLFRLSFYVSFSYRLLPLTPLPLFDKRR